MLKSNFFENQINKQRYLLFCVVAGFFAFSTNVAHPIVNSFYLFHEGEYVGLLWNIRQFYKGETPFPLLIHGAMDYIPATIATLIWGDEHVIVGTRVINTIAVWICWVLFLDLCYLLISKIDHILWAAIVIVIFVVFAPALHTDALLVQQAFLGTRDLFVVATIWAFAKYSAAISLIQKRLFIIIGTTSTVIAIFWAYDRGLMSLTFLGIIFLSVMMNKKVLDAMVLLLVALLVLMFLQSSNIFGSLLDNIYNITYWIKNSAEVFGISANAASSLILTPVALLLCVARIVLALISLPDNRAEGNSAIILGIVVIQLLLLKSTLNRPDNSHWLWSI
jgi:hypothetical protein